MRIRHLHILFLISFILLACCLYYLQIIKWAVYRDLSYKNSIRLLNVEAPRGVIYDRNNNAVAANALSFGVFIVPQEAEDIDDEIQKLSEILGVSPSLLKRNYKRSYQAPFAPCEVMSNVVKATAIRVAEIKMHMPGVLIKETPSRTYPYNEASAHVVGYLGEIDKRELAALRSYGYSVQDMIGKEGMEKVADRYLRGRDGGMQIQVDNRGRQVKVMNSRKQRTGEDVQLTIDAEFQAFIWKMMKGRKGAVLFMDVHNGEVVSMVSSPSYDPNESMAKVLAQDGAPLLNRAISGKYPPGSLFKIIVAMAGLESGLITPDTAYVCRGKFNLGQGVFHCWNKDGHGKMDLKSAIVESCNNYFYNVGGMLKAEAICEYAREFGLGKRTDIELLGEGRGFVPSRAWKKKQMGEQWYGGDTANLSIGQGYLLATPLQVVRFIAGVANGEELVEPHIIKRIGDLEVKGHKKIKLKIKKEHAAFIRKAMRAVVEGENGTGFRAWSDYVSISGKTGTSQTGTGRTHAWFGGFAPSDAPEIAFVIFLEHGGSGGDVAALMAKKAVEFWFKNKTMLHWEDS